MYVFKSVVGIFGVIYFIYVLIEINMLVWNEKFVKVLNKIDEFFVVSDVMLREVKVLVDEMNIVLFLW